MTLNLIEQLLQKKMGLHSATVGSSTVAQAVEQRMRDCGIDSVADYEQIVRHSTTELDALIDTVIIPETWFFRDRNPFSAFSEWLNTEWRRRNAHKQLRVMSVPCSTGEEPYTLAMCLADNGLPTAASHIDAIDISSSNIEKARKAVYGNNSFRGNDLAFRDRHFTGKDQRYQLNSDIQARVNFEQANILDNAFLSGREAYDIIFCRNLLIYFDRPTQHLAIDRLEQLLSPEGVLFLGHSETSLLLDRNYTALDHVRCFGFRRKAAKQPEQCPDRKVRPQRPVPRRRDAEKPAEEKAIPFAQVAAAPVTQFEAPSPAADEQLLKQAFKLADQGHLDEAAQHCETLLGKPEFQADTHFLLGLIREAAGNSTEAEQWFRKTVYLDPNHYQALTHLAMILAKQGDQAAAQRLRQRAERVAGRSRKPEVVE